MVRDRILIIDDEENIRELLSHQLAAGGYKKILVAANGKEGIAVLKKDDNLKSVGLVICDILMPGINGEMVVDFLREQAPEIPVVVISGFSDSGTISSLRAKGVKDYLVKPVDNQRLLDMVGEKLPAGPGAAETPVCPQVLVLSAEDDFPVSLSHVLAEFGLRVTLITAVEEPNIEKVFAGCSHADLVVADLSLSWAIPHLKQRWNGVPCVLMSRFSGNVARMAMLTADADDHLTKPVELPSFFDILDQWLLSKNNVTE